MLIIIMSYEPYTYTQQHYIDGETERENGGQAEKAIVYKHFEICIAPYEYNYILQEEEIYRL